jgi:hypothetical protein
MKMRSGNKYIIKLIIIIIIIIIIILLTQI